jgi:hypothetical protein
MFFVAKRSIHEGSLAAYALPHLPPEVRVAQADGDRRPATGDSVNPQAACWGRSVDPPSRVQRRVT